MEYRDRIYGPTTLEEPVLLDLLQSPDLQRLKGIDQAGYFEPYFPDTYHTRFEHSVGVCILLKKFGAPLTEQVAGLIHDVSHSAFSHCIDYVLAGGSETKHDHQDNVFDDFVRKSSIPAILEKHGLATDYILDDRNFPLKENDLPDLCADRLDYSIRASVIYGEVTDAAVFLDSLSARNGQWFFPDRAVAKRYAEAFSKLNAKYWSGFLSARMHRTVGDCLRYALERGYVTEADFYTTDALVLDKIKSRLAADEKLRLLFDRMNSKTKIVNDAESFDATVFCKSRAVDPLFLEDGELRRLSGVDPEWFEILLAESKPKQYFLRFCD